MPVSGERRGPLRRVVRVGAGGVMVGDWGAALVRAARRKLALWDVKAKALGVPVYELFGGPVRERQQVYWSHCGTSRARDYQLIGTPPLRSMEDIARLGEEVVRRLGTDARWAWADSGAPMQ